MRYILLIMVVFSFNSFGIVSIYAIECREAYMQNQKDKLTFGVDSPMELLSRIAMVHYCEKVSKAIQEDKVVIRTTAQKKRDAQKKRTVKLIKEESWF